MFSKIYSAVFASANNHAYALRTILAATVVFGGWFWSTQPNSTRTQTFAQTTVPAPTQPAPDRKADIELLRTIPQSATLAYVSFADGGLDENNGRLMTTLLTTASMTGLFNADQQILADVISAAVTIGKYPHAVFLLDAGAKKLGPGSYTLDHLSMGVVVKADAQAHGKFLAFIKQTLDHYFTADNAKLSWTGEDKLRRQKLNSPNFPDWCYWEWGNIGDTFIFTVGRGAYETVAKTVLTPDQTLNSRTLVQLAHDNDDDIDRRMLFAYADFDGLGRKIRPVMGSDYDNILRSFSAGDIDRTLISAGFTDRAFLSKIYVNRPGLYQVGHLTGDFFTGDWRAKAVPPQATSYGVSVSEVPHAIQYVVDTYLASRNPAAREKLIRNYIELAEKAGLGNTLETVFAHIGPMVITHDWPKHPMGIPLAKTMLIEHDRDPNLKTNWDKTMGTWRQMLRLLNGKDEKDPNPSAWESLFNLQLDRTDDGIWFVHVGPLVLVAAGLDDNFLVLSYAVPAVQANLNHLKTVRPTVAIGNR
jgi:hypothetical protein